VPASPSELDTAAHPVVLFDGVCNLCNGVVTFVIQRDPDAVFRFAPLQSAVAADLLADCGRGEGVPDSTARAGLDPEHSRGFDSVVLVEDGVCYTRSTAALRVAARLGWPYRPLGLLTVVPEGLRDAVYDFVAAHRYGWFGRRESCMVPSPSLAERFLVEPA